MKQKRKPTKIENRITIIIFIIIACFGIKGLINTYNYNKTINDNKFSTIAKVTKFKYYSRGMSETHYRYYYNNQVYNNFERIGGSNEKAVGNFFVVNLSTREPNVSSIQINKVVTNKSTILKSGFSEKDISKKVKY
jgi:hypothetical protein